MKFDEWNSIGNRLLRAGKITARTLRKALKKKSNGSSHMPIGDILVSMGACSREDIEEEVRAQLDMRAEPNVDHAAAEAAYAKLDDAATALRESATTRRQTLELQAWDDDREPRKRAPREESGKITIPL